MGKKSSLMKRLVVMFHGNPDSILTVSKQIEMLNSVDALKLKRNTILVYDRRLTSMGILERMSLTDSDEPAFRLASSFKALSYIEGRWQDYKPQVTPTAPPARPATAIIHRENYPLILSNSELEAARRSGEFIRHGRAPAYIQVIDESFSLRVWSSGKARIFLKGKGDWRENLSDKFGSSLVHQLEENIQNGNGDQGIAKLPLPVGKRYYVNEPDGSITTFQFGYSQIKSGELDRHGKINAPNGNLVEGWLDSETKFKVDVANKFSSLESAVKTLPAEIGKAVERAVEEALRKTLNKPEPEPEYKSQKSDGSDYSYG